MPGPGKAWGSAAGKKRFWGFEGRGASVLVRGPEWGLEGAESTSVGEQGVSCSFR